MTILDRWLDQPKPGPLTRSRAIRLKCLDCCGNQPAEVARCPVRRCPLWQYRLGRKAAVAGDWDGGDS